MKKIKEFYRAWVAVGKKVANVQIRVIFTVCYVLIIIPFGWCMRISGATRVTAKGWQQVPRDDNDLTSAHRPY